MRLAFVIFRYFPFGGLQRDMLALAREALARGHQLSIFCGDWQGEFLAGADIRIIKHNTWFNTAGVRGFVNAFAQHYRPDDFDFLLGFNKMPGLDGYFAGDSCFAHKAFAERSWWYRFTARARLYLRYESAVYHYESPTRIFELVAAEREYFARYYGTTESRYIGLPPGLVRTHCIAPNAQAARAQVRKEFGIDSTDKLILCVGSGFKTKGVAQSISAFAEWISRYKSSAYLLIVGKDRPQHYRKLAHKMGVGERVIFAGGREDMASIYAAADVLLHLARKEVAGNVLLEAMAAGVPVVVTKTCGFSFYIDQYAMGKVVSAQTTSLGIAHYLQELLSCDAASWQEKSAHFVKTADIFSRAAGAIDYLEQHENKNDKTQWLYSSAACKIVLKNELMLFNKRAAVFDERAAVFNDCTAVFDEIVVLPGEVVRKVKDRETSRIDINGRYYYRKWHKGVGWREIVKSLLQWRAPVLGANNEWQALQRLKALNIPSLEAVAFAQRGNNPARQESFIMTRELTDVIQLDHFFAQRPCGLRTKRAIIAELARIARELHYAGINHRDFYLCHFMLKNATGLAQEKPEIYLVDLHRAQIAQPFPTLWRVKDLGALYFSALDFNFTQRDILHFLKIYFLADLALVMTKHKRLLQKIQARAQRMYSRELAKAQALRKLGN